MPAFLHQLVASFQFRAAARTLLRRPAFVVPALVTLALGTSVTTTVFTVADTVLIKPLPYPDADRLVTVYEASDTNPGQTALIAPARLLDWNRLNRTFTIISGSYSENVTDTSGTEPERLAGRRVAPAFFAVFGVDAMLGRTFSADEERFGGPRAAVLSHPFWQRRYGGDPNVLGRALVIGNSEYVIVGVMRPHFEIGAVDVWLPVQLSPGLLGARNARFVNGIGRLRPGISVEQGRDDLDRVQRELAAQFPQTDRGWTAAVADLKGVRVGEHSRRLALAVAAVGLLWLIAITNVSGLVLVETTRRSREHAMRRALGASRARIAGVVIQEVLVLAMTAAAFGALIAYWALQYVKLTFVMVPRIGELAFDWRALLFAAVTSTVAALVCGLIPALTSTRGAEIQDVSRAPRGATRTRHRLQQSLVVAQVALGVVLCASALLLARSYANLTRVDVGFTADGVVAFHVAARWDEDRTRIGRLQEAIVDNLEQLPGVDAAGMTSSLPVGGAPWRRSASVEGFSRSEAGDTLTVGQRTVSAGYLQALQVPLLAGDWCPRFGRTDGPRTVLVNEALARRVADAPRLLGQRLSLTELGATYTIVGVIGNVAEDGPAVAASPYTYMCAHPGDWPDPEYVVRATHPDAVLAQLRATIRDIDPSRAVFSIRPLADVLASATDQPRNSMGLMTGFASAAMLLAATGLYGLFTLVVAERRRELGVRLALGAVPRQLVQLVCKGAGRLLAFGMLVGLAFTVGAGRWLQSLLFGISPWDGVTLVGTIFLLTAVSAIAVAIPAARAAHVSPSEALSGD